MLAPLSEVVALSAGCFLALADVLWERKKQLEAIT